MQREIYIPKVLAFEQGLKHYTNAIKKNSITFQDVEDTSFFDNNIWTSETIYANLLGSIIIKVLGVKHSRKIILMRQIVGNCPTNHLIVGI